VVGYVADALAYTYGRYEPEDTLDELLAGTHQLWIAFEDGDINGAVISHILQYPRKRFLGCPIVTGDEFSTWKAPMLDILQRFAADNDCEGLEATARLGWARVFKDDGYEALWQTFQLPAGVNHG
jgi:hypothetical protein